MMDMFTCYFDMDTGCVEVWLTDGRILSTDCTIETLSAIAFTLLLCRWPIKCSSQPETS